MGRGKDKIPYRRILNNIGRYSPLPGNELASPPVERGLNLVTLF